MNQSLLIFSLLLTFLFVLNSCSKTEDLITPYHYSIIPKVTNLKVDSVYMTFTERQAVKFSWSIPDTSGLRFFEIYRSQKNPDNYRILASNYKSYVYVDSTLPSYTDSLRLFYLVYPIGTKKDMRSGVEISYIGPPSDTLILYVYKKTN